MNVYADINYQSVFELILLIFNRIMLHFLSFFVQRYWYYYDLRLIFITVKEIDETILIKSILD